MIRAKSEASEKAEKSLGKAKGEQKHQRWERKKAKILLYHGARKNPLQNKGEILKTIRGNVAESHISF